MSLNSMASNRTGLRVDQHDVAEMKIAVDAAYQAAPAPLLQQRHDALVGGAAGAGQGVDLGAGKNLRMLLECLDMLVDVGADAPRSRLPLRPAARVRAPRRRHGQAHRPAPRRSRRPSGQACAISSKRRISTAHSTGAPLPAIASLPSASRVMAMTRAIDFRRIGRVDGKLGLAGLLALTQRRIVEKGKAHGTLDFQRALAGKKHRRRVGIDAPHLRSAMACRIAKKGQHLLLAVDTIIHSVEPVRSDRPDSLMQIVQDDFGHEFRPGYGSGKHDPTQL